ncbi:MAG: CPBP family intramembrane metalloprotease, partial [Lachnospiraceae bacterium]|nr:CPBP family intramembrane metalloprotease [Lachnospiraceae bacterium]
FHSAWNFSQNIIFGLPNSGNILGFSIGKLDTSAIGNSFFYNPNFGVEATGFLTLLMSVVFVVFLLLVCKSKKTPTDIWAKQQGRM